MPWIGWRPPLRHPRAWQARRKGLGAELTNNLVSSAQRTEFLSLVTEAGERALLARWDSR